MDKLLAMVLVISFVACKDDSSTSSSSSSSGEDTSDEGNKCTFPTGSGNAGLCNGPKTPRPSTGKCEVANGCHELSDTNLARAESQCRSSEGTWTAGQKCSTTNLVGRCMLICGRDDEHVVFAYSDSERDWCNQCLEAEGAWLGK